MEKYITDERTGLKYESVGDYYLIVGDDEYWDSVTINISAAANELLCKICKSAAS